MQKSIDVGYAFVIKVRRFIIPLFLIGEIFISLFSKKIVMIAFGEEYVKYSYWLIPLLIWILIGINNNFWGIQILLASGFDKTYSKCFQIGVFFTIVINLIAIYLFGGDGAAIAPALSELIISILLYIELKKLKIFPDKRG